MIKKKPDRDFPVVMVWVVDEMRLLRRMLTANIEERSLAPPLCLRYALKRRSRLIEDLTTGSATYRKDTYIVDR